MISQENFSNGTGLEVGKEYVVKHTNKGKVVATELKVFYGTVEVPVIAIRNISPYAIRTRFTFEQRVAIKKSTSAEIQVFSDDLAAKTTAVNLDSPKMLLAMNLLFAEGIISEEEKTTLLRNGAADEV